MWLFFLFCFLLERETHFLLQQFPCLFVFIWDTKKWNKERDLCSRWGVCTVFAIKCQEFRLNLQAWNMSSWNVWRHFSTCLRAPLDPGCLVLCTLHLYMLSDKLEVVIVWLNKVHVQCLWRLAWFDRKGIWWLHERPYKKMWKRKI